MLNFCQIKDKLKNNQQSIKWKWKHMHKMWCYNPIEPKEPTLTKYIHQLNFKVLPENFPCYTFQFAPLSSGNRFEMQILFPWVWDGGLRFCILKFCLPYPWWGEGLIPLSSDHILNKLYVEIIYHWILGFYLEIEVVLPFRKNAGVESRSGSCDLFATNKPGDSRQFLWSFQASVSTMLTSATEDWVFRT